MRTKKPTQKEIARAQAMVRDPGFKYGMLMHMFLSHCYAGQPEERQRMFHKAGIAESLKGAERRAKRLHP